MWSALTGRGQEVLPAILLHDVREIETWILRLLSAPVPVPGRTRVEVGPHHGEGGILSGREGHER